MAVFVALSTPNTDRAPDSAPRRLVSALPGAELDVVRFEREESVAVPYVLVRGVTPAEWESALADIDEFSDPKRLEQLDEAALYKLTWAVDSPLIHCMVNANGTVMQAHGTAEEWRLKIWFESGSDASAFNECCTTRDIPLTVDRLVPLDDHLSEADVGLSQCQKEALVLSYREGYFDEPRRISQAELAAELGISSSAVSSRLRRGFRTLVEETVIE